MNMKLHHLPFLLFVFFISILPGSELHAQWIVSFESLTGFEKAMEFQQNQDSDLNFKQLHPSYPVYSVDADVPLKVLEQLPYITAIQRNGKNKTRETVPNDTLYYQQWQLEHLEMPKAWDFGTGGQTRNGHDIVIAVMDEEFNPEHGDIIDNLWVNKDEIPDDGIDNDNNGYTDDYLGYDFLKNSDDHTSLAGSHGISVSGIIGARTNNSTGIAGMNWDIKMMWMAPVRNDEYVLKELMYIHDQRKRWNESNGQEGSLIVAANMSFGADGVPADSFPVLCGFMDSLGSVGVLPIGAGPNRGVNIDEVGDKPTDCKSPYLLAVTNSDDGDNLERDAGYGPIGIDVSAPGENSFTTKRTQGYGGFDGTSASAPYVSGLIGLIYHTMCEEMLDQVRTNPAAVASAVKEAVIAGSIITPGLQGMIVGGRISPLNTYEYLKTNYCVSPGDSGIEIEGGYFNSDDGSLTINIFNGNAEGLTMRVFDMLGRLIFEEDLNPSLNTQYDHVIDANWPAASYLVSIEGQDETASLIVIKSK